MGNKQECFSYLRITTTQNDGQQSKSDEMWASGTRRQTQKAKSNGSIHQQDACKKKNGGFNGNGINVPLIPGNVNNGKVLNMAQARPVLINDVSPTIVNSTATVTSDDLSPGSFEQPHDVNSGNDKTADGSEKAYSSAGSNDIAASFEDIVPGKDESIPSKEVCIAIIRTLGTGISSTVFEVEDQCSHQHYAMKRLPRGNPLAECLFISECAFLQELACKGVIKLVDCFFDANYFFILTELGTTDLFKRLKSEKVIPVKDARVVIYRLLRALRRLHKHNVVHRDIKPENIVFTEQGTLGQPKIIDFGDAIKVEDDQLYNELVGTRCYLSPERWRQHYGYELKASDIWAVGVLTYEMTTGKRCFYAPSDEKLIQKIRWGTWQFPVGSNVPILCADFIKRMLTIDPKLRPSAEHALNHPFFKCSSAGTHFTSQHKEALRVWCDQLAFPGATYLLFDHEPMFSAKQTNN